MYGKIMVKGDNMINILIIDDNIYYAKKLMDLINEYNSSIRVCSIAINGKEAIKMLNEKNDIDIFLLDLKLPIYNGNQILEMLTEEKKIKYYQSCIVISGEIELIMKLNRNNIIYSYANKGVDILEIINKINELIKIKHKEKENITIRNKINNELTYLGYNMSHKGSVYLSDAIYYIVSNQKYEFENLKKEIYPKVAYKHNKNVNNIKCNILRATEAMYFECETNRLMKYLNFQKDIKPKSKEIIYAILNKI